MNKAIKMLNEMYAELNNSEKWHKHKDIITSALTRPLDSELEEIIKEIRGLYIGLACVPNQVKKCNELADKIEQALRLTPKITSKEICEELNEWFPSVFSPMNKKWEYDSNLNIFYCESLGIQEEISKEDGFSVMPPIKLAHKITSFLIQESESE